ncbi:copper chaperone PCu(A)C [Streptomyces sp. NPDC021212]|uniref:copper chaperone PCu(A)C n=1 Tax=Streptomyces sp. NPDC021212 TaxID=3365118 RepID=UPI0037A368B1
MTVRHRAAAAAALALGLTGALTACGGDDGGSGDRPELSVSGAYIPRPAMADMAAGFLTVTNKGGGADKLTSITTPLAREVTLHTTKGTQMRQVSSLDVPGGGRLRLSSGGDHLMLTKLTHKPKVGEKVAFTLHFATSDAVKIKVPVEPMTYRPKD